MKLARSIVFSLSVAGISVLGVACGGTVEHAPQTSASAATKAPIGTNTHGVVKLVGDALGEVPLRAEQRTEIEKLAAEAEARHAPMADARKELMLAVAAQIESGTIDKVALQPRIDKMTGDFEKSRTDDRDALAKLHAILDTDQRNAFVDALEKQMKAKHDDHAEHAMKALGHFGKLKQLSDDLKLTDEQKTQIHDVMKEAHHDNAEGGPREHHRHAETDGVANGDQAGREGPKRHHGHGGKKAIEAFREDKLDLDKLSPPHDAKAMAQFGAGRIATFAEKIVPILTPEQRKIAADKLRSMAASGDAALLVH